MLADALPAVEAACTEAIAHGVRSTDVSVVPTRRLPILTSAAMTLRHAPIADCALYDNRRTN
jgi:hypothetical protein